MKAQLKQKELYTLLKSVFMLRESDSSLVLVFDTPASDSMDTPAWKDRREIAREWYSMLAPMLGSDHLKQIYLCSYQAVGSNNRDLPELIDICERTALPNASALEGTIPLKELLSNTSIILALTEFSATAPLKNLAKIHRFRGATLPGLTREMIPALRLDFEKIDRRVREISQRLTDAKGADIRLRVEEKVYDCHLDLRHRSGHASGGLMREPGTVGNLPSGEAYIVPYEGERPGETSLSEGLLPVQFGSEIVLYKIVENRAIGVVSSGPTSDIERQKLRKEPAYGNIAELGLGILGEWDVSAVGSILLDEKLGLHIAFGRSEHFGGITGPETFSSPENVVHIDRVYVPSLQPSIIPDRVSLIYDSSIEEVVMEKGKYVV